MLREPTSRPLVGWNRSTGSGAFGCPCAWLMAMILHGPLAILHITTTRHMLGR